MPSAADTDLARLILELPRPGRVQRDRLIPYTKGFRLEGWQS